MAFIWTYNNYPVFEVEMGVLQNGKLLWVQIFGLRFFILYLLGKLQDVSKKW